MIEKSKSEAYVFDFDDTLVKTKAKIRIFRNGNLIQSLSPSKFNLYKKNPADILDLSDFENSKMILDATPYTMWNLLQTLNDNPNVEMYILTARHKEAKPFIYKLLLNKGINISFNNIYTIGDNLGLCNIPEEKKKILKKISKNHSFIFYYDDNNETIEAVKDVPGLNVYLVD